MDPSDQAPPAAEPPDPLPTATHALRHVVESAVSPQRKADFATSFLDFLHSTTCP
jgi:hypothetical protein